MTELLTIPDVVERYGFSKGKLQELRDTGQIAYIQYCKGGRIFFRPQDVEEFLARHVHPARPKEQRATYRKRRV